MLEYLSQDVQLAALEAENRRLRGELNRARKDLAEALQRLGNGQAHNGEARDWWAQPQNHSRACKPGIPKRLPSKR